MNQDRKVWIVSSRRLDVVCDLLPSNKGRQSLVSGLIRSFGLHEISDGIIVPKQIHKRDLETFHQKDFVESLLKERPELDDILPQLSYVRNIIRGKETINTSSLDSHASSTTKEVEYYAYDIQDFATCLSEDDEEYLERFGLHQDCYVFPFMAEYVRLVAASSICAALKLIDEAKSVTGQNISLNWYGGRHHCKKGSAAGFCYVNDIVLSINVLRRKFKKVFYLDLDLHHGDGVEAAFKFSKSVTTCSLHLFDIGFYPGTGSLESSLPGSIHIPLKRGLTDENMYWIIKESVLPIISKFETEVIVLQCGVDGLATDNFKQWNMTIKGYARILELLLHGFPTKSFLILGGGGYNKTEVAKCWSYLTKVTLGQRCTMEWELIQEHEEIEEYACDSFQFWTTNNQVPKKIKNENDSNYLNHLKSYTLKNCIK